MCCDGDGKREWRMRVAESADALYVALTAGVGRDSAIALYRSVSGHGLPPTPPVEPGSQDYDAWYTTFPSTHRLAGQSVLVVRADCRGGAS